MQAPLECNGNTFLERVISFWEVEVKAVQIRKDFIM